MKLRTALIFMLLALFMPGLSGCLSATTPHPTPVRLFMPEYSAPGTILPRFTPHVTPVAVATPLRPGAVLKITPETQELPRPTPGTPQPLQTVQPQKSYNLYIVQPGETLLDIAQKLNIPLERLAKINNITDPTTIKPGDRLLVP